MTRPCLYSPPLFFKEGGGLRREGESVSEERENIKKEKCQMQKLKGFFPNYHNLVKLYISHTDV